MELITPYSVSLILEVFVPASWGNHQRRVSTKNAVSFQSCKASTAQTAGQSTGAAQLSEGQEAEDALGKAPNGAQRSAAQAQAKAQAYAYAMVEHA